MFASSDRLTFYLKNLTLFSRKVRNLSDFLPIFFKAFCTFSVSRRLVADFPSAIFQRFFALKSAMRLFFATAKHNKHHNAASALDNSYRTNKCSEHIFLMILVPTDYVGLELFSDDFSADRPTHFLGLEMTQHNL